MSDFTRPHTPRPPASAPKEGRRAWLRFIWIPPLAILMFAVAAGAGYVRGQALRESQASQELGQLIQEQFDLGVADLQATRYELARQRFEYILSVDPAFPGAAELLAESMKGLNQPTSTPSPTPVPATPTPTLDVGSFEGLFSAGQAAVLNQDWNGALEALLTLRGLAPSYRAAEVSDLLYTALRNRGLQKIFAGQREQGIYDLNLAERIRPLDDQAASWRRTAAFYMLANSYFGLDWMQAVNFFSQICAAGVWDSCFKYAMSALEYGDQLMEAEDPCEAITHYEASLRTRGNPGLAPTATFAAEACLTATTLPMTETMTLTPDLTLTITPSATFGSPGPTFTATFTPTAAVSTATPTPTLTPSPTPTPSPTTGTP